MSRDEMRKHIITSVEAEDTGLVERTRKMRRRVIERMDDLSDRRRDAEMQAAKKSIINRFNRSIEFFGKILLLFDEWIKYDKTR